MRQVVQNLRKGNTSLLEVPCPSVKKGHLLIASRASLVSAGTERMLVEFGRSGFLSKARQQPDKVKEVMEKMKTDGLVSTINAVQAKLDQDLPLGYCNAGTVLEVGEGLEGFRPGDRVANNGCHAEVVSVPGNLCVKIPAKVSDEEAAFTVLGSIALQGVRLAQPTLGESFAVIGLGLVGLLTAQILQANGCRVLGLDRDVHRLQLAGQFGVQTVDLSKDEDPVSAGFSFTRGRGIDGVLIATDTKSNKPVEQAARMSRKKGRIVLVGVTGLALNRADFYEKELTFQVSCSYGPGRYDPNYEEKNRDYPLGYVRWTEQRNFEAVLEMMASGRIDVQSLISHRFQFAEALKAYDLIAEAREPYLGIVLQYPEVETSSLKMNGIALREEVVVPGEKYNGGTDRLAAVGLIGAGNFTGQVLLPALKKTGVLLKTIASIGGMSATSLGKKFNFEESTSNVEEIFKNPELNTVFITTRHNTHAQYVQEALKQGKHVFVEKPLCIKEEELDMIEKLYHDLSAVKDQESIPLLMVGFNRRFSPFVQKMKQLLDSINEPKCFIMTVNAGPISSNHWVLDPDVGGGRIIGEACHFIDLLRFLTDHSVIGVTASSTDKSGDGINEDKVSFNLTFSEGSIGTVHYLANGHRSFPKERLEVFCGGRILALDNFKKLTGLGWPGFKVMRSLKQDKGHEKEMAAFIEAVKKGGPPPISFHELTEVTRVSFEVARQVR